MSAECTEWFFWKHQTRISTDSFGREVNLNHFKTIVTFGVAASSYATNMAVKQNAADHALEYPAAADTVNNSFYVDGGQTGADTIEEAIDLRHHLLELFTRGGFTLCKWNCSNPAVLELIPDELKDTHSLCTLPDDGRYTKTLGIEWNTLPSQDSRPPFYRQCHQTFPGL